MASKSRTSLWLTSAFMVVVGVLSFAYSRPAVADGLGALLQRLNLREVATSRELVPARPTPTAVVSARSHPGGISYGDTIWQQATLANAASQLGFPLLIPTDLPPGYTAPQTPATITKGNRDQVRLTYQKNGKDAQSSSIITVIEVRNQSSTALGRAYAIKQGSAEVVRIGDLEGVYVSGDWAPDVDSTARSQIPSLHFIVFEREGTKIWVYAPPGDTTKEELVRIAESLRPLTPST